MTTSAEQVTAATDLLATQLPDGAVIVSPEGIRAADRLWNGAVDPHPAAVVRCATTEQVRLAVATASRFGLGVSVVGGGHDWGGSAMRDGTVALDLAGMRGVEIRPDGTAVVQGGSTSSDLLDAALPVGLVAALGQIGTAGVVGLITGGGLGPLSGIIGLGIDNLLAADVVLADGRVVRADVDTEPELFWALRGGGGGFGVVTRAEIRLHPYPEVTAGMIAFPWSSARDVLRGWHEATMVDERLDLGFGAMNGPDGLALYVTPVWSGPENEGDAQLDRVRALAEPVSDDTGRVAVAQTVHAIDDLFPPRAGYRLSTRSLPVPDDDAIEALVAAAEAMPPASSINVHHVHGAATRVPVGHTAYGRREEHLVVEILGCWHEGDGGAERAWVADTERRLDAHALPGGWVTLLAPGDPRVTEAFGPNTARLVAAKQRYDPHGTFTAERLPQA